MCLAGIISNCSMCVYASLFKAGVCVTAFLCGFYCKPVLQKPTTVLCVDLKALSGLGCDGSAEGDPGIRASACSSSVLSSVEDAERKKHISQEWLLILCVAYT